MRKTPALLTQRRTAARPPDKGRIREAREHRPPGLPQHGRRNVTRSARARKRCGTSCAGHVLEIAKCISVRVDFAAECQDFATPRHAALSGSVQDTTRISAGSRLGPDLQAAF